MAISRFSFLLAFTLLPSFPVALPAPRASIRPAPATSAARSRRPAQEGGEEGFVHAISRPRARTALSIQRA